MALITLMVMIMSWKRDGRQRHRITETTTARGKIRATEGATAVPDGGSSVGGGGGVVEGR